MNKIIENNQVELIGMLVSDFTFSHKVYGESLYISDFMVERLSDNVDVIPVMVSERLIDIHGEWAGRTLKVSGQFRSYNIYEGGKSKLKLFVFISEIIESEKCDLNKIVLEGYVCKTPVYRKTPLGREIADILLAVDRMYGRTDYIPCIAWGENARYSERLNIGSKIHICGRIQSREYNKRLSDTEYEKRVAYEVSICKMEDAKNE